MWRFGGLALSVWLCMVVALAISSCGTAPGLTLRCDGRCHIRPADVSRRPELGQPIPAP